MDQLSFDIATGHPLNYRSVLASSSTDGTRDFLQLLVHRPQCIKIIAVNLSAARSQQGEQDTTHFLGLRQFRILRSFAIDAEHQDAPQPRIPKRRDRTGGFGEVLHHASGDAQTKVVGNAAINEMEVAGFAKVEITFDKLGLGTKAR